MFHVSPLPLDIQLFSSSTHDTSWTCNSSKANADASHASRREPTLSDTTSSLATLMEMCCSDWTEPITVHFTPRSLYFAHILAASSALTSNTSPSSSANNSSNGDTSEFRSTLMPQLPAKDISRRVTAIPPSLISWPAAISLSSNSSWVTSNAPTNRSAESRSGTVEPTWPYTWASADPPSLLLPSARSKCSRTPPSSASFRSGVTPFVMSGLVT
mmetsp:Transcript_10125/g.37060  ORF Transcript_10125/g.37060 Transcript_10125/m.37060 type:complete len:215 (-) Transcript_10125:470-1114(-)